jgi:hypothetical protein
MQQIMTMVGVGVVVGMTMWMMLQTDEPTQLSHDLWAKSAVIQIEEHFNTLAMIFNNKQAENWTFNYD